MAGAANLTSRPVAAPLLALGVAVLVGHALFIEWAGAQALVSPMKKMAEPVFARLLQAAPPPVPSPAPTTPQAAAPRVVATADPTVLAASLPPASDPAPAVRPVLPASAVAASSPVRQDPVPPAAPASAALADNTPSAPAADARATQPPTPPAPAASTAPPPARDTWPADTRLSYRLEGQFRGGPLYGSARVQWQRQGANYQAQVEIDLSPFGHRTLTSQGEVTARGLVPRVYEERSQSRRRALRLGDEQLVLADGRTLPRPADVQDAASQFVELGHRFATGQQALALGGSVPIWLARPGGVDRWSYDVVAQDLLKTPRLGEVMAWRLKPRPPTQRRDNLSAEIWFAPSLQYLPVRIRLTLGDEAEIDLLVDTIEQR